MGASVALSVFLFLCVLASLRLLTRLSDTERPGALTTVAVLLSAFVAVTALSGSLLALLVQVTR